MNSCQDVVGEVRDTLARTSEPIKKSSQDAGHGDTVSLARVLCIDYGVGFGGATKSTGLMLPEIDGIEFRIFTSQDPEIIATWYADVPTHRFRRLISYHTKKRTEGWLSQRFRSTALRYALLKAFAVADLIATIWNTLRISLAIMIHQIDVIHLINGYVPTEGVWASRLTGIPCIANMCGFWSGPDRLLPPSLRKNAYLVGDSRAVTDSVPLSWCAQDRRRTIYATVDVPSLEAAGKERETVRDAYGIAGDAVVFAIMGRVVEWKGQLEFVKATVQAMKSDPRIVGLIVGDGALSYMTQIETAVQESGFSDRFILTGYTAHVEPLYAAADVVVHASIDPEPCGMVVLEGMAARRPVIAAAAGGPLELVRHGVDGLLVPPGDVEGLCAAMLKLAADPTLRSGMGEHGHQRARDLFDVPVIAGEFRRLYLELASLRSKSGRRRSKNAATGVRD